MTSTNIANRTFEISNKGSSSGDYLKNKKSKLMYCSRQGICNNKKVTSYEQRNMIESGRLLDAPKDQYTNDLHSNLETELDFSGTHIVTDVETGLNTPINIGITPFYRFYNIDKDGTLFGKTVCAENNYVNYRTPVKQLPKQNVYWN
jgi:hypothetical protein